MYRAAMLLKERYSLRRRENTCQQGDPIGSGLGGPSSNAAAVLSELARLWDIPVTDAELMDLGARIGADVPLFLYGNSCIM
jgi:4-diphosphocytidyl-2-C-methyl-D-erythritol kinase